MKSVSKVVLVLLVAAIVSALIPRPDAPPGAPVAGVEPQAVNVPVNETRRLTEEALRMKEALSVRLSKLDEVERELEKQRDLLAAVESVESDWESGRIGAEEYLARRKEITDRVLP